MEKTQLQNYHVHYGPAQGWSRVDLGLSLIHI